ncbi:MAG: MipA/OmpV family protein [Comamonadaceae bacterium]|nr:MipA/OmpV family protein [Comamonadaceae bacterium]
MKSDDNQARSGMPDLDPTLEIGPALDLALVRSRDRKISLELRLPVRAVIATDFSRVHGEGWIADAEREPRSAWHLAGRRMEPGHARRPPLRRQQIPSVLLRRRARLRHAAAARLRAPAAATPGRSSSRR